MTMLFPLSEVARHIILASTTTGLCPVVPPPEISVVTTRQLTEIHQTYTKDELKAFRADTDLPHQMYDLSHVGTGGMIRSDINMKYEIDFDDVPGNTAETVNQSCVRYSKIRVTFNIEPLIFIASEYDKDSCWYKEIHKHEEMHIDVDENVVKKYSERVEDGLKMAFSMPDDSIAGPVDPKKTATLRKDMGRRVGVILTVMLKDLEYERVRRNQEIDSLGNFADIMNACYKGYRVYRPEP